MPLMKKSFIILITAFIFLSIFGCSSAKSEKTEAISSAIEEFNNESTDFKLICLNLKEQMNPIKEEENLEYYEIEVQIPNVLKLKNSDVTPNIDSFFDLNVTEPKDYKENFLQKAKEKIIQYTKLNSGIEKKVVKIKVLLKNISEAFAAEITNTEEVYEEFAKDLLEKSSELLNLSEEYGNLQFASEIRAKLQQAFPSELQNQISIIEIKNTEGLLSAVVEYPKLTELYNSAADIFYSELIENNIVIYEEMSLLQVKKELNKKLFSAAKTTKKETVEIVSEMDIVFAKETEDTLNDAAVNLQKKIEKLVVKAQKKPSSGILKGKNEGETVICKNESSQDAVLIIDNLSKKNVLTIYISSGKELTVKLPVGNYLISQKSGTKWYGTEYMFGNTENYFKEGDKLEVKSGYKYTISIETKNQ